jgi:hypothetical protein
VNKQIPIQDLYIVIEDLVYSRNMSVEIVMPYWNKKKEIGPQLARLIKTAGLTRIKSTPEEWSIFTDKGVKRINFTTRLQGHGYSDVVIIPK